MKLALKIIIPLIIIGMGVGVKSYLDNTRPEPKRSSPGQKSILVETTVAKSTSKTVVVSAIGTVIPAKRITLLPEVSGKIVAQNKNLVPGGHIKKGRIVVRIDPSDFDLALEQQRAKVTQATTDLAVEQGRQSVAEREWSLIREDIRPANASKRLVTRKVHLESAQAHLRSAESGLKKAELNRNRTVIKAPFDALVTEEYVDVGQVVGQNTQIATLVASSAFWVRTSVPMDRLSWIRVPKVSSEHGSPARVFQQIGPGLSVERAGQVVKLLGDLDPKGQMARILVEVKDPLGPGDNPNAPNVPLLIGATVKLEIDGPILENTIEIPRLALRENNRIWVKDANNKLAIRLVEIIWSGDRTIFVSGNVEPGEKIVTSQISTPVEGLMLREESENPPSPNTLTQHNGSAGGPRAEAAPAQ
jgi:membrane fusion protein (multidrug efflux system)